MSDIVWQDPPLGRMPRTRDELVARAARLRALRYLAHRESVFADGYAVTVIGGGPEARLEMQAHPGRTAAARAYFQVTAEPVRSAGFVRWTHPVGRPGHGLTLVFVEDAEEGS